MPTQVHARREIPSQAPPGRRQTDGPAHSTPAARHAAQLQSRLDASPRVQAAQRVVQRNGDGDDQSFFSKYIFGPHSYKVRHQATSPRSGESEEETTRRTYEALKGRPAPGAFGRSSSDEGRSLFLFPFGKISTKSNPTESTVTNETQVPHVFHQGFVKRKAIGTDIETEGGGHGLLPGVNSYFANWLWGNQAFRLRLQTDPEFAQDFRKKTWQEFESSGLNIPT